MSIGYKAVHHRGTEDHRGDTESCLSLCALCLCAFCVKTRLLCRKMLFVAVLLMSITPVGLSQTNEPIKLHPGNPHYFSFRGKPTILITSGEHYGAVINPDFDYVSYLDELQNKKHNLTRIFSGAMVERDRSIPAMGYDNTLAPRPGRLVVPWARSSTPGYVVGGNKFDLNRWDENYFTRLKDFVTQAGRRGIVVEVVLFGAYYKDFNWQASPLNAGSNINDVGNISFKNAYDLTGVALTSAQTALVRKVVAELKDFDNVYYEVCNEPYLGNVSQAWNDLIVATIGETEAKFPFRHLIAQNIANDGGVITAPNPSVSIFNFHYARKPEKSVEANYHLNKPIGDDETGFDGTGDSPYRREAWRFIIAGGALYDNLDWSFTPTQEDGTFTLPGKTPGGGSPNLRHQLKVLKEFIDSFDFIRMRPNNGVIKGGVPPGATARALTEVGAAYAIHIDGGDINSSNQADLVVELPAGAYTAEWLDTKTGKVDKAEPFKHAGGDRRFSSPPYSEDIAFSIKAAR